MNRVYLDSDILIREFFYDGSDESFGYFTSVLGESALSVVDNKLCVRMSLQNPPYYVTQGNRFFVITLIDREESFLCRDNLKFVKELSGMMTSLPGCKYERAFRYSKDNYTQRKKFNVYAMSLPRNSETNTVTELPYGARLWHTSDFVLEYKLKNGNISTLQIPPCHYFVYVPYLFSWFIVRDKLFEKLFRVSNMRVTGLLLSEEQKLFAKQAVIGTFSQEGDSTTIRISACANAVVTVSNDVFEARCGVAIGLADSCWIRPNRYKVIMLADVAGWCEAATHHGWKFSKGEHEMTLSSKQWTLRSAFGKVVLLLSENLDFVIPVSPVRAVSLTYDHLVDVWGATAITQVNRDKIVPGTEIPLH